LLQDSKESLKSFNKNLLQDSKESLKSFNKNLLQDSKESMAKEYNIFCLRPYLTP
jgi:hypothetical protein